MHMATTGMVLKVRNINEDRLITILTKDYGIITAYAGGARRNKGKLVSSTEFLCYSRFVLFKNKDKFQVDSAETEKVFTGLRADVEKLALANHMASLVMALYGAEEKCEEQLRLLLNCLHLLNEGRRENAFLKSIYELRSLTMAGFMPSLVACKNCAKFEDEMFCFSPINGEILCGDCFSAASKLGLNPMQYIEVNLGVVSAMRQIIYAPPEKLFSFELKNESLTRLGIVVEKYLYNQLEVPLPALEYYKSLRI